MAPLCHPLTALAIGVAIVLVTLLVLRLNAFIGLIVAAMVVSLLAGGEPSEILGRVGTAFGDTAGGIGIAIALAAVIGACLIASGAADQIVQASLALFGAKRGGTALMASGFVLSVPVFFDTVFFLLFPLAKSMHARTGKQYVKYLMAIGAGGAVTHTMVPPTPGPLYMAAELGVSVGLMMLVGLMVGLPMAVSGLLYSGWIDRRLVLETPPDAESQLQEKRDPRRMPSLFVSLLPIALPIAMIATPAIAATLAPEQVLAPYAGLLAIVADKNLALLLAAFAAFAVYVAYQRPTRHATSKMVEEALVSAGVIVLITAAGGAFGKTLDAAGVGDAIEELFAFKSGGDLSVLGLAFLVASMLKSSQGSTTVAILGATGMMASLLNGFDLGVHPVYVCSAIGSGAMITSWVNDSGFWLFCRMGGFNQTEGLKTWAAMTAIMGVVGMAMTLLLATVWPMG